MAMRAVVPDEEEEEYEEEEVIYIISHWTFLHFSIRRWPSSGNQTKAKRHEQKFYFYFYFYTQSIIWLIYTTLAVHKSG